MQSRIADTLTDSLARLSNEQQNAAETTAFDLQVNPARLQLVPGNRYERSQFWSVRVNPDFRVIGYLASAGITLWYGGHHDGAHGWAERRRLETHPATGAAQLLDLREIIQ